MSDMESKELRKIIQQAPYQQKIGYTELFYSILQKKNENISFKNERFFILKDLEYIAYARKLPNEIVLPFKSLEEIPVAKTTVLIKDIIDVSNEKNYFIVTYKIKENINKWMFFCNSNFCATEWRRRIESSITNLKDYNIGKFEKYEDYCKEKELKNKLALEVSTIQNEISKQTMKQELQKINEKEKIENFEKNEKEQQRKNEEQTILLEQNSNKKYEETTNEKQEFKFMENAEILLINSSHIKEKKIEKPIINKFRGSLLETSLPISTKFFGPKEISEVKEFDENSEQENEPNFFLIKESEFIEKKEEFHEIFKYKIETEQEDYKIFDKEEEKNTNVSNLVWNQPEVRLKESELKQKRQEETFKSWSDEWLNKENKLIVIKEFSEYMREKIIKEFKKISNKLSDKVQNIIIFEEKDIKIEFYLSNKLNGECEAYKLACKEFHNLNYFLQMTENKEELKVPLMILFEFQGICGSVRCISEHLIRVTDYNVCVKSDLEELTCINNDQIFQSAKIAFKPSILREKPIYFFQELKEFLPRDFFASKHWNILRIELVRDEKKNTSENLSKLIEQRVQEFLELVEDQHEHFINSKDLTALIHNCGLNVRHLKLLIEKTKPQYLKKIFKSEIIARCFKYLVRLDLQECVLKNETHRCASKLINLINLLFNGHDGLWNALEEFALNHFDCSIFPKQEVNVFYLLQAIQYNCNMSFIEKIDKKMFYEKDVDKFELKIKEYDLEFTAEHKYLSELIEEESEQNFNKVEAFLGVDYKLLVHFKNSSLYWKTIKYLQLFVSPLYNKKLYSHLHFETMFAELKWHMKNDSVEAINALKEEISSYISKNAGAEHPLFSELYDLLGEYYSSRPNMFAEAEKYRLKSVCNQKALATESFKTAEAFYSLGKLQEKSNALDAITNYRKSQEILEKNKLQNNEAYLLLCLDIQRFCLQINKYKDSYDIGIKLKNICEEGEHIEVAIENLELLGLYFKNEYKDMAEFMRLESKYLLDKNLPSDIFKRILSLLIYPHFQLINDKSIILNLLKSINSQQNLKSNKYLEIYFKKRIEHKLFPTNLFENLLNLKQIIEDILENNMIERWNALNKISNQNMLENIGNNIIHHSFEFIADLSALNEFLGFEFFDSILKNM